MAGIPRRWPTASELAARLGKTSPQRSTEPGKPGSRPTAALSGNSSADRRPGHLDGPIDEADRPIPTPGCRAVTRVEGEPPLGPADRRGQPGGLFSVPPRYGALARHIRFTHLRRSGDWRAERPSATGWKQPLTGRPLAGSRSPRPNACNARKREPLCRPSTGGPGQRSKSTARVRADAAPAPAGRDERPARSGRCRAAPPAPGREPAAQAPAQRRRLGRVDEHDRPRRAIGPVTRGQGPA